MLELLQFAGGVDQRRAFVANARIDIARHQRAEHGNRFVAAFRCTHGECGNDDRAGAAEHLFDRRRRQPDFMRDFFTNDIVYTRAECGRQIDSFQWRLPVAFVVI
ncbi:hypothetical protein C6P87_06125 [Burkholderia sp. AU12872]|nr:hypothetical protein C6P87_06125 [Burkholderia sp. AU12872]